MSTASKVQSVNGIDLGVLGKTIESIQGDFDLGRCTFRARNKWIGATRNRTSISGFHGAKQEIRHKEEFELYADEPPMLAGEDRDPNPAEYLLNALAGCVTTSIVAHAAVRGVQIEQLESELEGDIDLRGFLGLDPNVPKGFTSIRVKLHVKTDPKNIELLKELAAISPVYNTITQGARVDIDVEPR